MNPRQIVHTLLLISEIILYLSILIFCITGCVQKTKKKSRIWLASKSKTLKLIIKDMNEAYPLKEIISENQTKYYIDSYYKDYLIHSTKSECEKNYKKCGILDSMGNIMCIPNSFLCPMNEIKTSLSENSNIYEAGKYYNYTLYFTNQKINNSIITNITISNETLKYITTDNFIFDEFIYDMENGYHSYSDGGRNNDYDGGGGEGGGGGGGGHIGDGGGAWRNLWDTPVIYGNDGMTEYILKKFNEKINIDIYYKKIDNNLYYRNYIGFENYKQMEEFINTDFSRGYYNINIPHIELIILGFIFSFILICLISFSICRFNYEGHSSANSEAVCNSKCAVIFVYLFIFALLFTFILIYYCDLCNVKINCNSLKKIKSEIIIEDFIKSFCSDYNFMNNFLFAEIVLFSISFFIFFIAWIVHIILQILIDSGKISY